MADGKPGLAVITGASGGIGYELARLFARDGYPLLLAARNGDKLREVAAELTKAHGVAASVLALDLTTAEAQRQLAEEAERLGPVAVLVNNAGFGLYGPFVMADLTATLEMVQLNVVALTHLSRLLLPGMVQRGRGKILNVASMASFFPGPLMGCYYATKAFVLHLTEALDVELHGTGVRVAALCPGPTETGFKARAGAGTSRLFQANLLNATVVAEIGYRGLMAGRRIIIPGVLNRIMLFATRLTPRWAVARIVGRMQATRQV
jgi:short-subunit dehydrogenase